MLLGGARRAARCRLQQRDERHNRLCVRGSFARALHNCDLPWDPPNQPALGRLSRGADPANPGADLAGRLGRLRGGLAAVA